MQLKRNKSLDKLALQIEETKILLNDLISKKQYNLLDVEVLEVSKVIDKLLFQYQNLK
jgi:hypothetical protein